MGKSCRDVATHTRSLTDGVLTLTVERQLPVI